MRGPCSSASCSPSLDLALEIVLQGTGATVLMARRTGRPRAGGAEPSAHRTDLDTVVALLNHERFEVVPPALVYHVARSFSSATHKEVPQVNDDEFVMKVLGV